MLVLTLDDTFRSVSVRLLFQSQRYPTLRKVARDIFAIPVTTVASESAFSMSGRIVDDHRSRLTSKMLEVLMCYQNWLRNKYKGEKIMHFLSLISYVSSYLCL